MKAYFIFLPIILLLWLAYGYSVSPRAIQQQMHHNTSFKVVVTTLFISIIAMLISFILSTTRDYKARKARKSQLKSQYFKKTTTKGLAPVSLDEYDRQKKLTTEMETAKLMQTPEYQALINARGNNPGNHVWQTAEKEGKFETSDVSLSDHEKDT